MKILLFLCFLLCFLITKAQDSNLIIRSYDTAKVVAYYSLEPASAVHKQLVWLFDNVQESIHNNEYSFEEAWEYTFYNIHLILFNDGLYICWFSDHWANLGKFIAGHYRWDKQHLFLQLPRVGRKKHVNSPPNGWPECNSPFFAKADEELVFTSDQLFFIYQPATQDSFYLDFYINEKSSHSYFYRPVHIQCFSEGKVFFEQKGLICDSLCRLAFSNKVKIDSFQFSAAFSFPLGCEYVFKNTTFYFPKDKQQSSISIFRTEELYPFYCYHHEMKWSKWHKVPQREFIKTYGLPTFAGQTEYRDNCYLPPIWAWPVQAEKKFYILGEYKEGLMTHHWKENLDFGRVLVKQDTNTAYYRTLKKEYKLFEHPVNRFFSKEQGYLDMIDTTSCD